MNPQHASYLREISGDASYLREISGDTQFSEKRHHLLATVRYYITVTVTSCHRRLASGGAKRDTVVLVVGVFFQVDMVAHVPCPLTYQIFLAMSALSGQRIRKMETELTKDF
jgi:hypothetical protein